MIALTFRIISTERLKHVDCIIQLYFIYIIYYSAKRPNIYINMSPFVHHNVFSLFHAERHQTQYTGLLHTSDADYLPAYYTARRSSTATSVPLVTNITTLRPHSTESPYY